MQQMAEEVREVVREVVKISDLLDQARAAEAIVLPEEVRANMCPYDVVRLRLLTFRHMIALADFAAANPVRWNVIRTHHMCPGLKQKTIAELTGAPMHSVRAWINHAVINPDIWQGIPMPG